MVFTAHIDRDQQNRTIIVMIKYSSPNNCSISSAEG